MLESDRQFYTIGERICFAATYKFSYPLDDVLWSNVLYVELVRWNGEKIALAKFKLQKNSLLFSYNLLSEGNFTKPDYGSINTNRLIYRNNLLLLDPDIELNQHNPRTLSFYASDSKGEYIVFIRSINARGKAQLYGTCRIVVE